MAKFLLIIALLAGIIETRLIHPALAIARQAMQEEECDRVGVATAPQVVSDQLRKSILKGDFAGMAVAVLNGADPALARHTKWFSALEKKALNRKLVHAAAVGNNKLVLSLLGNGADVNFQSNYEEYWPPLIWASLCDHSATVELLLDHGASIEISGFTTAAGQIVVSGITALTKAASYGNADVVSILLNRGANPNHAETNSEDGQPDTPGNTALITAGTAETSALLLKAGANPNFVGVWGVTALMHAADFGDLDQCRVLLEAGANPKLADFNGLTAADRAEQNGHHDAADLIRNWH